MVVTGSVSYIPENHQEMTDERQKKVDLVQNDLPKLKVDGKKTADLLIVGWGGTYGHLRTAFKELEEEGKSVALAHFNYINPLPPNVAEVFSRYKRIVVCELNMRQFANYLRMNYPQFKYEQYNKVQGLPFTVVELKDTCSKLLKL